MSMGKVKITKYAETLLPTSHGEFRCVVFRDDKGLEHLAMIKGDLASAAVVACRVHSECLTGEVFGSLKCDCKQQLDFALETIQREGNGVLLYMRQEGRGIGLGNKIRAYALQEKGADTVDANRLLGFPDDARDYQISAEILAHLGIKAISLMTNNPTKIKSIEDAGILVTHRAFQVTLASKEASDYLEIKRKRMGHL